MASTTIGGSISNALGSLWGNSTTQAPTATAMQAQIAALQNYAGMAGAYQPGTAIPSTYQQYYPPFPQGVSGTTTCTPYPFPQTGAEDLDKLKKELLDEIDIRFNDLKREILEAIASNAPITINTDEIRKAIPEDVA